MSKQYYQGMFVPKHPEKYVGDLSKITYRSSWEFKFHQFLDMNPNVLRWSSETVVIPYVKPTDGKVHRYFPDYWIEYRNKSGNVIQEIVEVKPLKQTRRSRSTKPQNRLYEDVQFAINVAKWKAAQEFCKRNNLEFRILTENSLFK